MSWSRKPNSISGLPAQLCPIACAELERVGRDPLGVLAGVGVARLDRVGQRAHGREVGVAQLLRARPLLLEGLAQVGGVALELVLLLGRVRLVLGERRAQTLDLLAQVVERAGLGARHGGGAYPAAVSLRTWRTAAAASSTGTGSAPRVATIPRAPRRSVKTTHRAAEPPPAQVERLDHRLRAAHPGVDERDLVAVLLAHARGGGAARDPVVVEPDPLERRLEPRLHRRRGRRRARACGPASTAEPSASVSCSASIGFATVHSPASASRPEYTETTTTERAPAAPGRRAAAASTSKPLMPGIRMSSVIASKRSRRRCSSASAPEWAIVGLDLVGLELHRDQLGDLRLVVDHQHPPAAQRLARQRSARRSTRLARDPHGEDGALAAARSRPRSTRRAGRRAT